jgi:hypothetical protein
MLALRNSGEGAHRNCDNRTTEEIKMFSKTATILAAAVVLGSTWSAFAYWQDPSTGLPTEYYYGPVAEHVKQGLPVRAETVKKYAPSQQKGAARAVAPANHGGSLRLLEARPNIIPAVSDAKHSGHLW